MSKFLSIIANKIANVIAPTYETLEEEINGVWQTICNSTLDQSPDALHIIHELIAKLINLLKEIQAEEKDKLSEILESHQIPLLLYNFSKANIPNGFFDEALIFFIEFTVPPLSSFLDQPYFIQPLNSMLEQSISSESENSKKLFESILSYIIHSPGKIDLFILSPTNSPFFSLLSKKMFESYTELGQFIFQLLVTTKNNQNLHQFILNCSPFISNCISFIVECINTKTLDPQKQKFLSYIDISLQCAPPDYAATLCSLFHEQIIQPFIVESSSNSSLSNSIYILSAFSSKEIILPIINIIGSNIEQHINPSDETSVFLSARLTALLLEFVHPKVTENSQLSKIFVDFISLVPSEWFVEPELDKALQSARSRVNMSYFREKTTMFSTEIDLSGILSKLLNQFENFMDNSVKVNLSLCELFSLIASLPGPNTSFFSFSEDCENGLVKAIKFVCTSAQRRVGKRENTMEQIKEAYKDIDNENGGDLFRNVVVLLEFLTELTAIAKSKSVFNQRDFLFVS